MTRGSGTSSSHDDAFPEQPAARPDGSFGDSDRARSPRSRATALALPVDANAFERHAHVACFSIAANDLTRRAYWGDYMAWRSFYREHGFDPAKPPNGAVEAWVESLKRCDEAPKTRARRMSALSSIYRRLCRPRRDGPPIADRNPFSADEGPDREQANALEPTPIADPNRVRRVLETCGGSEMDIRDAAIIRVFWATGIRRASLIGMTFARLCRERQRTGNPVSFVATVIGKRGKEVRILIRGNAAAALERWLAILEESKFSTGPIWRSKRGPMTARDLGHMLDRRTSMIGEKPGSLTPHGFRVAFLTYNPAGLEAKQDAAGHADPKTTRIYDRASWRGRAAFEQMPEIEDCNEEWAP